MTKIIQVSILDDHQTILDGYRFRLDSSTKVKIVATMTFGSDVEDTLKKHPTDVLVLDINVPTSQENSNPYPILYLIPSLLQKYPNLAILVISMHTDRSLIRSVMEAGASGYILKDDKIMLMDIENVIISIAAGEISLSQEIDSILLQPNMNEVVSLSQRQKEVLSLSLAFPDDTTAELAKKMSIANSTVRNLLSGAYIKLGVRTRVAAIAKARKLGILTA
ncbi:MAG TPA: response regulator transcription factor [Anaerolineales bacterium]|nr:response regulator transcription factor [Anaerolineales bacterium]